MNEFSRELQVRWSDLDPNFHLRHSVYYDWGAFCRVEFLNAYGLTPEVMLRLRIGPILFHEEALFKKEIRLGEKVEITLQVLKARRDYSRWSIQHHIIKNESTLSAILTVEGSWLNVDARKLAAPSEEVHRVFEQMPKAEDFSWIE